MLLIPADDWQRQHNHFYGKLGLPQDPKVFLEPVIKHLDEGLERLSEAVERGEVHVDDAVHLDALKAEPGQKAVEDLRRALFESPGCLPFLLAQCGRKFWPSECQAITS